MGGIPNSSEIINYIRGRGEWWWSFNTLFIYKENYPRGVDRHNATRHNAFPHLNTTPTTHSYFSVLTLTPLHHTLHN